MGKGFLFQRKFKKKNGEVYKGEIYWLKYYRHGKAITESTKTTSITKAQRMLNKRWVRLPLGFPWATPMTVFASTNWRRISPYITRSTGTDPLSDSRSPSLT
jgi:hypothetical protein